MTATDRSSRKTRYPGIYEVRRGGKRAGFMVSFRIPGQGQTTKTFRTLREACDHQAFVKDPYQQEKVRQLGRGRVALSSYLEAYLESKHSWTPSTRLRNEGVIRNYVIPGRLGGRQLSSISRDDVRAWVADLHRAGVGPGTIDKAHRTLRAALEAASLDGKLLSNPARRIEVPAGPAREVFFLTADQVDLVANEVPPRHRALVLLLAYTGIRIGEASALRVRHLDLIGRSLQVLESSAEVGGRKITGKTKNKRSRVLELSEPMCVELAQHLERFGPQAADGHFDPAGYVFTHTRGGQIRQNNFRSRVFQPACERTGVVRLRFDGKTEPPRVHDLRHTAASLAAMAGYSLHEVKEMLGHSTIKMTSDLYMHLFSDQKTEKAGQLGELMVEARSEGRVVEFPTLQAER